MGAASLHLSGSPNFKFDPPGGLKSFEGARDESTICDSGDRGYGIWNVRVPRDWNIEIMRSTVPSFERVIS